MRVLELLNIVNDQYRDSGVISMSSDERTALISLLERAAINREQLAMYMCGLETIVQEFDASDPLQPGELQAILDRQWEQVSDQSIGLLALRPAAILALGKHVWRRRNPSWLPVLERIEQFEAEIGLAADEPASGTGKQEPFLNGPQLRFPTEPDGVSTLRLAADTGASDSGIKIIAGAAGTQFTVASHSTNEEWLVIQAETYPEMRKQSGNGTAQLLIDNCPVELVKPFNSKGRAVVARKLLATVLDGKSQLGLGFA